MEENDRKIAERGGSLNLLIDSSVYHEMQKVEDNTGLHPLDLLEKYPKIQVFFTDAMINENIRGKMGFGGEASWLFGHSLRDEGVFSGKEARFLYNHEDGTTKVITMNNISAVDYGQILVAQNHKNLTLLTHDHRMLKSAGALLSSRLMDLPNLFAFMKNTEDLSLRDKWMTMSNWYDEYGGFTPPERVNYIEGIIRDPHPLTGEIHAPKPEDIIYTKKKR